MSDPIKVRTVPALLAPFASVTREFVDILRNPVAFFGGLVGTGMFAGGVTLLVLFGPRFDALADEDKGDELDMEFLPGELMRKGEKIDPQEIPEKIIVEETVAAEAKTETKVTKDEKAAADPEPKKNDKPKDDVKATEKPDPNKKGAKESDKNRDSNDPYKKDPPTVKDLPGDPFGDPDGWSDINKAGDPWATAVMKALNGMKVGVFGAQGKDAVYQFQLDVCPDGKLKQRKRVKSSGDSELDGKIENALGAIKVPLTKEVIAALGGGCKKIRYDFTWKGTGGGSGSVK